MKFLLIALLISFGAHAQQNLGIITDKDDTISLARIVPRGQIIDTAARVIDNEAFSGMPELFQELHTNRAVDRFFYLSTAPTPYAPVIERFLARYNFPTGPLITRKNLKIKTPEHKVTEAKKIMDNHPDLYFLLIGDNGEYDAQVYNELKNDPRYAKRIKGTFIHQLYSGDKHKLFEGQKPFVTSADLALGLYEEGLLSKEATKKVFHRVLNDLADPGSASSERAFPDYFEISSEDLDRAFNQHGEEVNREFFNEVQKIKSVFQEMRSRNLLQKKWLGLTHVCKRLLEAVK